MDLYWNDLGLLWGFYGESKSTTYFIFIFLQKGSSLSCPFLGDYMDLYYNHVGLKCYGVNVNTRKLPLCFCMPSQDSTFSPRADVSKDDQKECDPSGVRG